MILDSNIFYSATHLTCESMIEYSYYNKNSRNEIICKYCSNKEI